MNFFIHYLLSFFLLFGLSCSRNSTNPEDSFTYKVGYVGQVQGDPRGASHTYIAESNAQVQKDLTPDFLWNGSLSISPKNGQIALTAAPDGMESKFFISNSDLTDWRWIPTVISVSNFKWSPSGQYVALSGVLGIDVMDQETTTSFSVDFPDHHLLSGPGVFWEGNSNSFIFVAQRDSGEYMVDAYRFSMVTREIDTLTSGGLLAHSGTNFTVDATQRYLVFSTFTTDRGITSRYLQKFDLVTSELDTLLAAPGRSILHDVAVSPDGSQIAFLYRPDPNLSNYEIFLINIDGSGLRQLTNLGTLVDEPVWRPDGDGLAFLGLTPQIQMNAYYQSLSGDEAIQLSDVVNCRSLRWFQFESAPLE